MLLKKLRSGTEAEHMAMEKALDLLSEGSTLTDYVYVVKMFEAFVGEWERLGGATCPPEMLPSFLKRQRHSLLVNDLKHFAAEPLHDKPTLPSFADPSAFLGAMYVMEGSTLGGQFISRHLEKEFGLQGGEGYSFFQGHGTDTGKMWKDFSAQLEEQAQGLDDESIVEGARKMFLAFHQWIDTCKLSYTAQ